MSCEKEDIFIRHKSQKSRNLHFGSTQTRQDFLKDIVVQFIHRRKTLGLTQEDVDIRMGNSDRQCSKWECGLRTPTSFNFFCWAEALESHIQLIPK